MNFRHSPIWLLLVCFQVFAVQLENWRGPFYTIGAQRGEVRSSGSGMFWDDINGPTSFGEALWPDSTARTSNFWTVEPSVSLSASDEPFINGNFSNYHFDLLSDFRIGDFLIRNVLDVDQGYADDPLYPFMKKRISAGRFEEAYIQYTKPYFFLRMGRAKRNWGPFSDRSIFLSNNPFAYDGIEFQLETGFLEFRHLFVSFPRRYSDYDVFQYDTSDNLKRGQSLEVNRFLTAHSLNFIIGKWAVIGLTESVVFVSKTGFPDFQYVNPFSIYTVTNTNQEAANGNLMLGLQAMVHPFTKKVILKGQVVFDDFQVDDETAGDKEPTHWACDVGGYVRDIVPIALKNHFSIEYRYLSKWVYTVPPNNTERGERYTYLGRSLGYPEIDGDEFIAAFTLVADNYWTATLGTEVRRFDRNTVASPWLSDPVESGALGYRWEMPLSRRETVEKMYSVFLEGNAYWRDYLSMNIAFENQWIKKSSGDSPSYNPIISATISAHFPDFILDFDRKRNGR